MFAIPPLRLFVDASQVTAAAEVIPFSRLAFALLPVAVVLVVLQKWSISPGNSVYAIVRMLVQLLILGYALTHVLTPIARLWC